MVLVHSRYYIVAEENSIGSNMHIRALKTHVWRTQKNIVNMWSTAYLGDMMQWI